MKFFRYFPLVFAALILPACDETDFESAWQNPSLSRTDLRTEAVGAFLLSGNDAVRLSFEQNLARELNKLGIEAIPGYELIGEK
jgi:hypothetical protein